MFGLLASWIARHPARAGTVAGWYQQACGLAAAVVAVPLVIRLLPPVEAGLWFSFQSLLAVLQLTDFGFTLALSRQVAYSVAAREPAVESGADFLALRPGWQGVSDVYALTCRVFRAVCAIGFVALAFVYHAVLPLGKLLETRSMETAACWYILGLSTLLLIQSKPHQALLEGMARVWVTRLLSGTQLLLSGFGVVAVLLAGGRLVHMTVAVLLTAVLNYAAFRWLVNRAAGQQLVAPVCLARSERTRFLRVSGPLGVLSLSAFMVTSIQVPLVGFLLGSAAVPAYYLAQRIGMVLNQACIQFVYPQLPLFTQEVGAGRQAAAAHRMRKTLTLVSVGVIVVNAALYLGGPALADVWVGPGRCLSGLPLLVLAVDFCLMNGAGAWGPFVLARGTNPFMWSTLVSGLITLTLCLVLGVRLGVVGVTLASLLAGLSINYWFVPWHGLRLLRSLDGRAAVTA